MLACSKRATQRPVGDNGRVPTTRFQLDTARVGATVDPQQGGRLAQLTIDDIPLLIGADDLAGVAVATGWGSFPMVPWVGRIRHGRFTYEGVDHQLPINFEDHAIHGVGFDAAWEAVSVGERSAELHLSLPTDRSWPFGGHVTQRFEADDEGLTTSMTVTADERSFPCSFGWHPWFRKPTSVDFSPTAMYRRDDDHIAVDELVAVPDGPWDDCFLNTEPVVLAIGGTTVRVTSDCDHWVVYDERSYATCVEPQTGPPDSFNIAVRRLEPGESVSGWYRIAAD